MHPSFPEPSTCARILLAGCFLLCESVPYSLAGDKTQQLFAVTPEHQSTNSNNSAETMNTRSMTAIDDVRRPTAAEAITHSPFFRLPREIRDEVYDLVALSEERMLYSITLKANERPQKAHVAPRGASYACSVFMAEYQDAVTRRVKALMGQGDGNGLRLSHFEPLSGSVVKVKMSEGESKDEPVQNIHAVRLVIPTLWISTKIRKFESPYTYAQAAVVFQFKFPDKEQTVDWKGCMRENMVWHNFFARYARPRRPQKSLVPVWSAQHIASLPRG
jgi:hypothetical protein